MSSDRSTLTVVNVGMKHQGCYVVSADNTVGPRTQKRGMEGAWYTYLIYKKEVGRK